MSNSKTSELWKVGEEISSVGQLVYIPILRGKQTVSTVGVYGRRNGKFTGRKYVDRFGEKRVRPYITAAEARAKARRIVACVNACAGIPTEALERGVVGELVKACKAAIAWAEEVPAPYRDWAFINQARAALAAAGQEVRDGA